MASIKLILIVHESAPVLGIFRWSSPIKSKSKVKKKLKKKFVIKIKIILMNKKC